jgi:D-serine deaminase-like pyridoxal phosphate-dependent protein
MITFGLPDRAKQIELNAGDRLELPAGLRHDAIVGSKGVVANILGRTLSITPSMRTRVGLERRQMEINEVSDLPSLITKPTLLLDEARALRNIDRMVAKARNSMVVFRPHFKTHQSAVIGEWFRDRGVRAITVSSVDMAYYFAENGWNDITLAFPVNLRQIEAINYLAKKIKLNLLLESVETASRLDKKLMAKVGGWIKIDAGYHRTGISWDDIGEITGLATLIQGSHNLEFEGILTHAGHTYGARPPSRIVDIYFESVGRMISVRRQLRDRGMRAAISVGDTPGCSLVDSFGEVDEVRPGNFIFYDLSQLSLGSCRENQMSVGLACPVVAKHVERNQIVLYGGAVHLSKESLPGPDGSPIYGRVAKFEEGRWSLMYPGSFVSSLSQEHGIVQADDNLINTIKVGDFLVVLPVHSCLTVNLMGGYLTLTGEMIEMARF